MARTQIILSERRKEDWRHMLMHDLNAPLSNIYAVLRRLQEEAAQAGAGTPDAETLAIGLRNCRRMMGMLELYLAVARFDACLMPVRTTRLKLADFVRECVAEQSFLAAEKDISVIVDVPPALKILGDSRLLARAIQNLLNNALKFSPRGARVDIAASRDAPGRAALSIRDAGPGIDRREIPLVFDRYAQARELRRKEGAGTGLGLTFCRLAITAMKGTITVRSKLGKGSVFTLHLPVARSP